MLENEISKLTEEVRALREAIVAMGGPPTRGTVTLEPTKPAAEKAKPKPAPEPDDDADVRPDVKDVQAVLVDLGRDRAKALLAEYDCDRLPQLSPDAYASVIRDARAKLDKVAA